MAILIDSNIIIYSYLDEYRYLRKIIVQETTAISEISRVEVLGYHKLTGDELKYFESIFSFVNLIIPSPEIFDKAIEIRKLYNLKLGDSIIASTALVHRLSLYTRNTADFENIKGLECINPIS